MFAFDLTPFNPNSYGSIGEVIVSIANVLFAVAIPLLVIMVVYSGIRFLTSKGNPAKTLRAKEMLWYAFVGLAIVLIGSGFITFIQSIISFPTTS